MKYLFLAFLTTSLFAEYRYGIPDQNLKADEKPQEIKNIDIKENIGSSIDLNVAFTDENKKQVLLKDFFVGKPVIISMVYYGCPNLCNFHLSGMAEALGKFSWKADDKYEYVVVSIDPKEDSDLASDKKTNLINEFASNVNASQGWHFLTGKEESIKKLASELGFGYQWNKESNQWVHGSAAFFLDSKGKISRVLHGINFPNESLKLALLEASEGKIGTVIDRAMMFCYQYNGDKRKYSLYVVRLIQAGGGITMVLLALFLMPYWRKNILNRKNQGVG